MLEYRTEGFKNFGVKYSPFIDSRIAVSAGANFGLVGNGRLYILELTPQGIVAEKWYDTQDCLYDLSWSEAHSNQLVTASGDGSVKLFDTGFDNFPVRQWTEHTREVFSVSWNLTTKDTFASSSWDGSVKIYSPDRAQSLQTLLIPAPPSSSCTYSALFSPHNPSLLSAVSTDSNLRIFDLRQPPAPAHTIPIHHSPSGPPTPPSEALTHDWNKYRPDVIATGSVDHLVRTFDIRMVNQMQGPVTVLDGHGYAVRKVSWSPHAASLLLSASYDMTVRAWRDGMEAGPEVGGVAIPSTGFRRDAGAIGLQKVSRGPPGEVGRMSLHTEFVAGLDWCLFGAEGWCASAGWDEKLLVWDVRECLR